MTPDPPSRSTTPGSIGAIRRRAVQGYAARPLAWAVVIGALLFVAGLAVFAGLLDAVQEQDDISLADRPVLSWMLANRGPTATTVFSAITLVSGPVVLPVIVAVACLVWARVGRERWRPLVLAGAMLASTAVSLVIKDLVARPRPPIDARAFARAELTASFPSGHTIGAATLLLVAGYLVVSRGPSVARVIGWAAGAVVGILAVALSRLYLGYHFLTDVLAAVALAVAIGAVAMVVDRRHALRRRPECPRLDSNQQPTE
ncbi:phosphatase PAP2 family protein [Pengzhenrongella sicca]|uniref:Phosphatase PAP2 family protein n=1 Tax=Pengzhenrongella sicca TaxID=2819238 RepID=A0A8A4ZLI4_9MICO|nr:phosphatase PAP2 family protein [Pengzhenrongella sicca]QTE30428.1 phosphatase PAP2 family protein [Pengzhenrongella sicca]